jgi:hypothetical protein
MDSQPSLPSGPHEEKSLPPVQPPSAGFILQLFLIPLILVTLVVGFIIFFFGWIGAGPETPKQFMEGLNSPSGLKRGKTAQDLAQILPRKQELRGDVGFALDLAELLHAEMQKPPTVPIPGEEDKKPYLLEYYLPSAVGSFHVPAGLGALQRMVDESKDRVGSDEGFKLRMRNGIFALGLLGARMREYDALPETEKERIHAELKLAAEGRPGLRQTWAQRTLDYLEYRQRRSAASADPFGIVKALEAGARAPDELTRKYTILALANWDEAGCDDGLLQMCGDHSDIPDEGFEHPEDRPATPEDRSRGIWEIRHNAALALARRGSAKTPWDMVLAALDESNLASRRYPTNPGMAASWVLKALRDLDELKRTAPEMLEQHPEVLVVVTDLSQNSPTIAVQVQAQKLLVGTTASAAPGQRISRELLMIIGLGAGVLVLLAVAVIARWKRAAA